MKKIIISSLVIGILCGCSMTKKDFGLEKDAPDEMLVVSRSPLSIPPEFGLRPIVFEETTVSTPELSAGEQALLEKMK